ncbi:MAG: hypothetical protein H7318_19365 [Oligoflexus sp.]|nr:hypothetical protein [Oligoflexus sp.]
MNSIYGAGEANKGIQTAAYNLPNDEKIATAMGTKRTMLKNIQEAKFQKVLIPISKIVMAAKDGTFSVDESKIKDAVKTLTGELLTIQATGDKAKADLFVKKYMVIRPSIQAVLNKVKHIPVDIEAVFTTADELLKAYP